MSNKLPPFASIDHSVIDSPAFSDLSHSAVRVLLIITRQCNGSNNGLLQATYSYCKDKGVGSEHTLQKAIAELIAHGFIYRTRGHGFEAGKNTWAKYAITWRSLCAKERRKGLFVDNFEMYAWRKWPFDKKSDRQKVQEATGKKCSFMPPSPAVSAGNRPAESAAYELLAITRSTSSSQPIAGEDRQRSSALVYRLITDPPKNTFKQRRNANAGYSVRDKCHG